MSSRDLQERRHAARDLVESLQARHVARLQQASPTLGQPVRFEAVDWQRDGGRHGGGRRFQSAGNEAFDQASVNVSLIHYDDLPDKRLSSATALSAIVHPRHPRAPSMHLHVSWTALRSGRAYWRIMADLNPALPDPDQTASFLDVLRRRSGSFWHEGAAQGDRYFSIPALGRTRGVAHFYLEAHDTGDFQADLDLARGIEEGVVDTYGELLEQSVSRHPQVRPEDRAAQLAYHTLYLFQVLTLDRGTTSGLLVHAQNDAGILGSLPSRVDRDLLASWEERVPEVQRGLVRSLAAVLPEPDEGGGSLLSESVRLRLAQAVRAHYQAHPEALQLQARGEVVPPTVANHR